MLAALETIQTVSLMVGILGIFTAGVASLIVIIEKITGSLGWWFERHLKESLEPTNDRITDLGQQVEHADAYNRYHLGPNGLAPPIHVRIQIVEKRIAEISDQDGRLLRMMQAAAKTDTD
jgi:hypothetical protein